MMRGGIVEFTTDARADKVPVEQDFVRLSEPVHGAVVSEVFSDFGFAFDSHFLLNRKIECVVVVTAILKKCSAQ